MTRKLDDLEKNDNWPSMGTIELSITITPKYLLNYASMEKATSNESFCMYLFTCHLFLDDERQAGHS